MLRITLTAAILLILAVAFFPSCTGSADRQAGKLTGEDSVRHGIEQLTQQIREDQTDPELYNKRAQLFLYKRQFDQALQDVQKAISISGDRPGPYITLADIYLLMGRPDDSRESLKKALTFDPENTAALLRLGKLYLIVRDYQNCYTTISRLLAIDDGVAPAYFIRAVGLLEQGDTLRAVDDLKKAVDKDQEYYEALVQLGALYSMKKDPLSEMYLKNALALQPQSREALYMLGMYYQETMKYDLALSTYQRLEKSDTAFREASYNQGYICLVYLKDFPRAAKFFTEAIRKDPEYYEAWFNRGYAYELSGDYKKAYTDYRKSLKIKVNYDKAIEGLNRLDKTAVPK